MNIKIRNALLSGLGFYGVWIALTLIFSNNTLYQLLLGAISAVVFGVGTYWFGQRRA